jgi:GntR family transcriptional regulator
MLNPSSPIPLYRQLAAILRGRIEAGEYACGDRIPSEHELAARFAIGRPTVRQATDTLVRDGWLVRRRGAGTFVEQPRRSVDLFSLAGTSASFLEAGHAVDTRCLDRVRRVAIDPERSEHPFRGRHALRVVRTHACAGVPVLLEEIFLEVDLFLGLERMDLEGMSLARIVTESHGLEPCGGTQSFRVEPASDLAGELLDVPPDTPLLMVERTLDFPDHPAAIFAELRCRTDTFVFRQSLAFGSSRGSPSREAQSPGSDAAPGEGVTR